MSAYARDERAAAEVAAEAAVPADTVFSCDFGGWKGEKIEPEI
jgi:hypothetical protein